MFSVYTSFLPTSASKLYFLESFQPSFNSFNSNLAENSFNWLFCLKNIYNHISAKKYSTKKMEMKVPL